MQQFRPPAPFLAATGLVLLATGALLATGGLGADPVAPALLFVGVGVALPEAYLVLSDRPVPRGAVTERGVLVVLTACGYAAGLAVAGHPTLVGTAAMAGAFVAEGVASARRASESAAGAA